MRYALRDPDLAIQNKIQGYGVEASVQRSIGQRLALRLSGGVLRQEEESADRNDREALRSSFGLVFYPLARSPRSRGVPLG
jgi:hypothetical protein